MRLASTIQDDLTAVKTAQDKQLREDQEIAFRLAITELAHSESLKKAFEDLNQFCRALTQVQLTSFKTIKQFDEAITTGNLDERSLFEKIQLNLRSIKSFWQFIKNVLSELAKYPILKDSNIQNALSDVFDIYLAGFPISIDGQVLLCHKVIDYIGAIDLPNSIKYRFECYQRINATLIKLLHLCNSIQSFTKGFTHQLNQIHTPFESISFDIPSDDSTEPPEKVSSSFTPITGQHSLSPSASFNAPRSLPVTDPASSTTALVPSSVLQDDKSNTREVLFLPNDITRFILDYLPFAILVKLTWVSKTLRLITIDHLLSQPLYKGWVVLDLLSFEETCRLLNITSEDDKPLAISINIYRNTSRQLKYFNFCYATAKNPTHACFGQYARSFYGLTEVTIDRIPTFFTLAGRNKHIAKDVQEMIKKSVIQPIALLRTMIPGRVTTFSTMERRELQELIDTLNKFKKSCAEVEAEIDDTLMCVPETRTDNVDSTSQFLQAFKPTSEEVKQLLTSRASMFHANKLSRRISSERLCSLMISLLKDTPIIDAIFTDKNYNHLLKKLSAGDIFFRYLGLRDDSSAQTVNASHLKHLLDEIKKNNQELINKFDAPKYIMWLARLSNDAAKTVLECESLTSRLSIEDINSIRRNLKEHEIGGTHSETPLSLRPCPQ